MFYFKYFFEFILQSYLNNFLFIFYLKLKRICDIILSNTEIEKRCNEGKPHPKFYKRHLQQREKNPFQKKMSKSGIYYTKKIKRKTSYLILLRCNWRRKVRISKIVSLM